MKKIQNKDLNLNWHPCAQMYDYKDLKPLVIKRARGSYIELANGKKIIDAISSWWCKSLGHNHPLLKKALISQLNKFEHVIFANTTNEVIVKLSQKLTTLLPNLKKVFYAGDGSCAIEIAMKMSLHARQINKEFHKNKFISLTNGYHGETAGALSVSDLGMYRAPYQNILFDPILIKPPYVLNVNDLAWNDSDASWRIAEKILNKNKDYFTAIILEPVVQGAGGMKIYSQDFLTRLNVWAQNNDVHIIADEIMTGLGRTGKMLACEHANITPDFVCLSKGLTSGFLPFSAVLLTEKIYQNFYAPYQKNKNFLHSHTYCGNVLGASVALKTLELIEKNDLCARANKLQNIMYKYMQDIATKTKMLANVRGIGAIVAADLIVKNKKQRLGYEIFKIAMKNGAFLRPLGNTIYWLPPLNVSLKTVKTLYEITLNSIMTYAKCE